MCVLFWISTCQGRCKKNKESTAEEIEPVRGFTLCAKIRNRVQVMFINITFRDAAKARTSGLEVRIPFPDSALIQWNMHWFISIPFRRAVKSNLLIPHGLYSGEEILRTDNADAGSCYGLDVRRPPDEGSFFLTSSRASSADLCAPEKGGKTIYQWPQARGS